MDLGKFLKSQTFKTGAFILLVLFILLMVFKLGVVYGYKKSIYSHKYGNSHSQTHRATFFGHHRGAFNEDIYGKHFLNKKLIIDKMMLESKTDEESRVEELTP